MSDLVIKHVSKSYGSHLILDDLSFAIEHGEFMVIVGPSGCGKSTLLKMVAGLESIQSGEIIIGNVCVNKKDPKDRNIAMVFQNYALYPHMSVFDNMAYGLKNRGVKKAERKKRVSEVAKILQLEHLLERKPRELSGGQRQRVAMGRAIVREPLIFLFDEPLSNLDTQLRTQMRIEIKRLQTMLNITSLYVTHDQTEAMTLADRIFVMNEGKIEQIGTPLEIYNHPETVFVASFMGMPKMNFIEAEYTIDQHAFQLNDTLSWPIPCQQNNNPSTHNVILGLRPEHLTLNQQTTEDWCFEGTIDLVESLGADIYVYGTIVGTGISFSARLEHNAPLQIGTTHKFYIHPEKVHVFDAKTEKRLPFFFNNVCSIDSFRKSA